MAVLSDEMWARIEPGLPPLKGPMGRPFTPHRNVIEGAIYRLRTGGFWRWVICYRQQHRPRVVAAVATYAPQATFTVLRHSRALADFVRELPGDSE